MATQSRTIFPPGANLSTPYDGTTISNLGGSQMTVNGVAVLLGTPYTVPNGLHVVQVLVDQRTDISVNYTPPAAPGSGGSGSPTFYTASPFYPSSPDATVVTTKTTTTLLMNGGTGNMLVKVGGSTVATLSPGVAQTVSIAAGTLTLSASSLTSGPASVIGY